MAFKRKKSDKGKDKRKKRVFRIKVCKFCVDNIEYIDYKDVQRLQRYVTEKGKMISSKLSGNCGRHQRHVALAIKRARQIALLPYAA